MNHVFKVPTKQFREDLGAMAVLAGTSVVEEAKKQGKGIVRELSLSAAPGSRRVQGAKAKARGRARVRGDILRAVLEVPAKQAETTDVASAVERLRDSRGRIRKRPARPVRVGKTALLKYVRDKQDDVGVFAGGWNRGAAKLGYRPPAWIWKQNSPGSAKVVESSRGIRITLKNRVRFASSVRYAKSRVIYAVENQGRKLKRQIPYLVARAARRRGFKSR